MTEFVEAFYILWDNLLGSDVREILQEYRRRQTSLLTAFGLIRPVSKLQVSFLYLFFFYFNTSVCLIYLTLKVTESPPVWERAAYSAYHL